MTLRCTVRGRRDGTIRASVRHAAVLVVGHQKDVVDDGGERMVVIATARPHRRVRKVYADLRGKEEKVEWKNNNLRTAKIVSYVLRGERVCVNGGSL